MPPLSLTLLDQSFAIHRLSHLADVPAVVLDSPFFSITRTDDELSIVVPEAVEIQSDQSDSGWACFKVNGPLDFSLTGVLAGIASALAEAKVPIFALSTFDTDYILVKQEQVQVASDALQSAGNIVEKEAQ
jgi:hypothetical protein